MSGTSSFPGQFTFRLDLLSLQEAAGDGSTFSASDGGGSDAVVTPRTSSTLDFVFSSGSPSDQVPTAPTFPGHLGNPTMSGAMAVYRESTYSASLGTRPESVHISSHPVHRGTMSQPSTSNSSPDRIDAALDVQMTGPATQTPIMEPQDPLPVPRLTPRRRSGPSAQQSFHKVDEEELPSDRYHEASFQGALASTKQLMCDLSRVLGSGSIHLEPDSVMRSLHERAELLGRFEPPSTRTIGFVGDTGVGKPFRAPAMGAV